MIKIALSTIVALAGISLLGNTAQAADGPSRGHGSHDNHGSEFRTSHSAPIQLAGYGNRGSSHRYHGHNSHYRGHHDRYRGHSSHYRGHSNYHRGHGGYHRGPVYSYPSYRHHGYRGYDRYNYGGGGIGFSGRNFSFYYGF